MQIASPTNSAQHICGAGLAAGLAGILGFLAAGLAGIFGCLAAGLGGHSADCCEFFGRRFGRPFGRLFGYGLAGWSTLWVFSGSSPYADSSEPCCYFLAVMLKV